MLLLALTHCNFETHSDIAMIQVSTYSLQQELLFGIPFKYVVMSDI